MQSEAVPEIMMVMSMDVMAVLPTLGSQLMTNLPADHWHDVDKFPLAGDCSHCSLLTPAMYVSTQGD